VRIGIEAPKGIPIKRQEEIQPIYVQSAKT
jgi:sRNA-binding carbon storage regulator CsrA